MTGNLNFLYKSLLTETRILNQAKNIFVVLPNSLVKILKQIGQKVNKLWSEIQTNEQTKDVFKKKNEVNENL